MRKVYLDNAATTPLRAEVIEEMMQVLANDYGNPSSSHGYGRHARSLVELARKSIARQINANAQEILFTSGGTEGDNWIIRSAVRDLGVRRIITSKIEHHAVLHTVESVAKEYDAVVDYVRITSEGAVDVNDLARLLSQNVLTLVTLMHVNNEIGTVLDLHQIGTLCRQYKAYFHSDTVQSIGKVKFDLQELPIDFLVASAHKFHGPKGVGFMYIRKGIGIRPMFFGGEQEKGFRAGTEAVHNIVGMSKALELGYTHLTSETEYVKGLKNYAIGKLKLSFPSVKIAGSENNTFYNIINACLAISPEKTAMILFNLDMKGISVSRGSACQSGSTKPSHVLAEILSADDLVKPSLRISFSHFNTVEEIDYLIEVLQSI